MKTTWMSIEVLEKRFGVRASNSCLASIQLDHSMTGNGVLSRQFESMLALGICIAARRSDCISNHLQDALRAGASRQEILEVIEIGMIVGGERSIRYGAEAVSVLRRTRGGVADRRVESPEVTELLHEKCPESVTDASKPSHDRGSEGSPF